MKTYIVYVGFAVMQGEYSLNFINEEDLELVVNAYKSGAKAITLAGKKRGFVEPRTFFIYEVLKEDKLKTYINSRGPLLEKSSLIKMRGGNLILRSKFLEKVVFTKNVTTDFIGNLAYGELKVESSKKFDYVSKARIIELQAINNSSFDLTKVIKFCKEINDNWARENYISVATLVRALKDHVPPIFTCTNFNEVANNYSGGGGSFKNSMKNLQSSLKNISDRLIHSHISRSVALPTDVQVNFSQDLDVMLEQIVEILK